MSNPTVWLVVIAITALLIGGLIWGIFGYVDTTVESSVVFENHTAEFTVKNSEIKVDMTVRFDDTDVTGTVSKVKYDKSSDKCHVVVSADIPDGKYTASIVTKRERPISFVLN